MKNILKVNFDELETSDYDMFLEVTYKGQSFTGIGYEDTPSLYSEYLYKDGKGHGKCFTVSKNGEKIEEFELFEGKYINERYEWYDNGQLKWYIRWTPPLIRRAWNEAGRLLLEEDKEAEFSRTFYSTGELKCEYKKPKEWICYSKKGDWIYKHSYECTYDYRMYGSKYVTFNDPYIEKNYIEILYENSFHNYIFLWLEDILINDRTKAVNSICDLIGHENLYVKDKAITIAGRNNIKEARPLLEKALEDKRIPPFQYDSIDSLTSYYKKSISEQARIKGSNYIGKIMTNLQKDKSFP